MQKTIELVCETCSKTFSRRLTEHNRNLKKNRRCFCGRSCQGKANVDNLPKDYDYIKNLGDSRYKHVVDDYSHFRPFMRNIQRRTIEDPSKIGDIDLKYLKELWESQCGICPYTKWELKFLKSTSDKMTITPDRASLDRIDSSKGYIRGNVVFVAWMYNIAKNIFTNDQVLNFCEAVYKNK